MRNEGCRIGRVGRSPIRFFDLILNNALALRGIHERQMPYNAHSSFEDRPMIDFQIRNGGTRVK